MALDIGTRLGPYEITGRLGAGGMGQVFKARDTRLNRTVAIKVSNEAFTARFEHEARAVAALNHPNICQLYDVGPNYLVLEHVAGAPVMPTDSARKLLDVAVQIADGMAAAHEAGFVHRDLKPSNVLVTPEGRVKILDFGLVKNVAPEGDGAAALTVTAQGLVAGTTAYMSPEQARGEPTLDARSDQFSFGLVLYELATGKRPFDRATGIETLAAIIRDDPEPLPPKVLAPLRWIVARCLAKEPRDRYDSSRDLYLELKNVQANVVDASGLEPQLALGVPPPRRGRWQTAAAFAAGAVAIAALGLSLGLRAPREEPELRYRPIEENQSDPVWSPDSRSLAYTVRGPRGGKVHVRDLDAPVSRPITSEESSAEPVQWTTDGRIILKNGAALSSIREIGGVPIPFAQLRGVIVAFDVSPDGSAIVSLEQDEDAVYRLYVRSPPTAARQRYTPAAPETITLSNGTNLRFSSDGKKVLLTWMTTVREAWLMPYPADPENPPRRVLDPLPGTGFPAPAQFSWLPGDRIVLSGRVEAPGPVDLLVANLRSGEIRTVSHDLTSSLILPRASPDGSKLVFQELAVDYDILSVSLTDAAVTPILATPNAELTPAWAARKSAMVYVTNRSGAEEIWLHEPGEQDRPIVTANAFADAAGGFGTPALSPDATRVIYVRTTDNGEPDGLYISAVDGGPPVRLVNDAKAGPGSWSPDGNWFVYVTALQPLTLEKVRTTGQAEPEPLKTGFAPSSAIPSWSPRDDWILYSDGGAPKLISIDGRTTRDLKLPAPTLCAFGQSGVRLYCLQPSPSGPSVFEADLEGNRVREIGLIASELRPSTVVNPGLRLSLTPDGQSLSYSNYKVSANRWLLEGLDKIALP